MPIWTLAKKDLRLMLRDTRAAIILLTMPLVFIVVLGMALGDPDERLQIFIVNEDKGLPPNPGPYPPKDENGVQKKWSDIVIEDLEKTAGIQVDTNLKDRAEAERLVRLGKRSCVLVFKPDFGKKVHYCSFLDDKFLEGQVGINPFFRDGVDLNALDVELLRDPKQPLASSIVEQVAQVSLLRVVMPWMIGKAFDKISEKQFIDEMGRRVEFTLPIGGKRKWLGMLDNKGKAEVGEGVQDSLQEMFKKYNLRAKNWESLTQPDGKPGDHPPPSMLPATSSDRRAQRFQLLVPGYTVMFAFFLVLTVGWLFVSERRQGTLQRLRAAPLSRAHILFGKLLPCYFVSLAQGLFLIVAGWILFDMNWGPRPFFLVPVVATTSLAAVGLSVLVASVARTESQVSIYGTLLVLVLGGLSGCLMPRYLMPEQMQHFAQYTPHAWALDAYQELLLDNPQISSVLISCGVLSAFGIGFIALAWWLLRLD
jgi:ABC-2 type transport system permease protein